MGEASRADFLATEPDAAELQRRLEFAEQLLACFQQVVGHELPNHLIAIQGLARVLEIEEGASLNPESREYLRRLGANAGRGQLLPSPLAGIGRAPPDSPKGAILQPHPVPPRA